MLEARRQQLGTTLLWIALGAGLLHAAASAYWASGGRALLETVGPWAVDLTRDHPTTSLFLLLAVAAVKALAAIVPLAVQRGRLRRVRGWRALSWTGGAALIVYGGVNTVVALLVLAGAITPDGGYDRDAMIGHAYLWDPLFLIWGLALVGSLWCTRPTSRRTRAGLQTPAANLP